MVHHAGPAPVLSMETAGAAFEPAEWLYNGTGHVRRGAGDALWDARWTVNGVTSRLTMLPAAQTEVFALETYPTDNAFITENDPPCQTLCVRRNHDAPFVAVWDAWTEAPNLTNVTPGNGPKSVKIVTQSNVYYMVFGGETAFPDGVTVATDGVFALYRASGAVMFAGGTFAAVSAPEGTLRVSSDGPASISAECAGGVATLDVSGNVQYDTWGGVDRLTANRRRFRSSSKAHCGTSTGSCAGMRQRRGTQRPKMNDREFPGGRKRPSRAYPLLEFVT